MLGSFLLASSNRPHVHAQTQVHFGPLFPEPRRGGKHARPGPRHERSSGDGGARKLPQLGRGSRGPAFGLGRRERFLDDAALAAARGGGGGFFAGTPAGGDGASSHGNASGRSADHAREWGDPPPLGRRSVSRWAGAAAATLGALAPDLRALLTHALAGGSGSHGGGRPLVAAAGSLDCGGAPLLECAAGAAAGGSGRFAPSADGSPSSTPQRELSPNVSGRARAAASLLGLGTLQVRCGGGCGGTFGLQCGAAHLIHRLQGW